MPLFFRRTLLLMRSSLAAYSLSVSATRRGGVVANAEIPVRIVLVKYRIEGLSQKGRLRVVDGKDDADGRLVGELVEMFERSIAVISQLFAAFCPELI